ncbi:spore protease YyaC [Clostridium vincentii]|uniref:Sporulation protein YyaC n=1 Tax=Clostridium vincentii TaxID=52704 RepID=A0A2T0BBX8_9CLOT|nr:spore protease YyaC [Clostridium vincentii]PRR81401.1 hypothetical protein CLVI_25240 [Clostridium vincentii]
MDDYFSIDSNSTNSYCKVRDYLYKELKPIVKENRNIIFLCIGTDRSTGDSLGPLIGYKLRYLKKKNFYIYGTLSNPIHAKNLAIVLERINENFDNPFIIAIDSCLGHFDSVGKIFISNKPLYPGLALNKSLPPVGNMSITGIVNICGAFEFMVLQNTRLFTVMSLADSISNGIYHFVLKCSDRTKSSCDFIEDLLIFPNS